MKTIFTILAAGIMVVWFMWPKSGNPELGTRAAGKILRDQSDLVMRSAASNNIVGITRIVRSYVDFAPSKLFPGKPSENFSEIYNDPKCWVGELTAEFINRVGGIERTNVVYSFAGHQTESELYLSAYMKYQP